ncbi:MAG: hypothetical protein JKX85_11970, partial [Phycisphaeraceae bacterium]|nr:hypothetical protein [Phycisphaeraceae bacterium]
MAGITLPQTPQEPTVLPRQYLMVQIKKKWADPWQTVKYLSLAGLVDEVAPAVSHATFVWHWGNIKFEDSAIFEVTSPQDIANWFIRVGLVVESDALSLVPTSLPVFVGVITPSTHELLGDGTTATGAEQTLTAFGLLHLLDQVVIDQSWVLPFAGPTPIAIDRLLDINEKVGGGYSATIGNRSAAKYVGPYGESLGESYVFSDDGLPWTLGDYLEYLQVYYPPGSPEHGDIDMVLSGQTDSLQSIVLPQQAQRWRSFKEALDDLIISNRGLGYVVRLTDVTNSDGDVTGTAIGVHVFSTSAKPVNIAGSTLPANAQQALFDPASITDAQAISIQIDPTAQFNKLIIRGQPVLSCFTLSFADATLRKGWLAADETAYLAADATTRASDALVHVYRLFALPSLWNWVTG